MTAQIDGPRVKAKSGQAKQLVVFLHGYGADGNDLIEIGRQWRQILPDADFVAPHAPERCAMSPSGRQWFPLTMRDPNERWDGALAARPTIDAFLDAELASRGLDDSALALVGFSQGTMLGLHVGLRRKRRRARFSATRACWSRPTAGPRRTPSPTSARRRRSCSCMARRIR